MKISKRNDWKTAALWPLFSVLLVLPLLAGGCSTVSSPQANQPQTPQSLNNLRLGYTIQAGAFADVKNAADLSRALEKQGMNAYYYLHSPGLYKVRFGNFATLDEAARQAENFVRAGMISDYYLVRPDTFALAKKYELGEDYLREQVIDTACEFIGIRYRWGAASQESGFDCSGLTTAVYQLNGFNLPRTSKSQFQSGRVVTKDELKKGDLVFFATRGGKRVTHVGIYAGQDTFIHAPSKGRFVETSSMASRYFSSRFLGARSYLDQS